MALQKQDKKKRKASEKNQISTFLTMPDGEQIYVEASWPTQPKGVLIIAHGLAGYKEENVVRIPRDIFFKKGYAVVVYDARFSLGQGTGALEKACFSNFIQDLQAVINWSKTLCFFKQPFILCGHSLGAGAALHYACEHTEQIQAIIGISSVYNGQFLLESYRFFKPDFVEKWKQDIYLPRERRLPPMKVGRISYAHLLDACRYHLETQAGQIKCPVFLICSNRDISSTVQINETLMNALSGPKELIIIPQAGHAFDKPNDENALKKALRLIERKISLKSHSKACA